MKTWNAIGLFCEDIREEKSGQDTIIGILPDNLNLPSLREPNMQPLLPKFCSYVRVSLDIQDKPKGLAVKLMDTKGSLITQGAWDQSVIDKAFSDAAANNMLIVGLIWKMVASPFPVMSAGKITASLIVNGAEHIVGALNIIAPTATASPPPA
jgi:hypothetical protein